MKSFGFFATLAALAVTASAHAEPRTTPEAAALMKSIGTAYQALHALHLKMTVKQEIHGTVTVDGKTTEMPAGNQDADGRAEVDVKLLRPRCLYIDVKAVQGGETIRKTLISDGKYVWRRDPASGGWTRKPVPAARGWYNDDLTPLDVSAFLDGALDFGGIHLVVKETSYSVVPGKLKDGNDADVLVADGRVRLTPNATTTDPMKIEVRVNRATHLLAGMLGTVRSPTEDGNTKIEMTATIECVYSAFEKDPDLKPALFAPPAGARVTVLPGTGQK